MKTIRESKIRQVNKLAVMLGLGGMNGSVSLAAIAGFFKPENAFALAVLFMAGPGAIILAVLLGGPARERMLAALLAGVIATIIVVLAAGAGPIALSFFNMKVLQIFGGIAIAAIALIIMGVAIPEKLPTLIMAAGLILSLLIR